MFAFSKQGKQTQGKCLMSTSFRAGTVSSCDVSAAEPGTRLQSPVGLQHFLFFIANVKLPAIPTDGGWPVEASSLLGGL